MPNDILFGTWQDKLGEVASGSIDLIITDPPYGATPHSWDKRPKWDIFFKTLDRVVKPTSHLFIFTRMPWALGVGEAAIQNKWRYVQEIIWEKQNAGGCTVRTFRKVHENIWHFKKPQASTFNLASVRTPKTTTGNKSVMRKSQGCTTQFLGLNGKRSAYIDDGLRIPKSVFRCRNLHRSKESLGHATQKPLELIEPLILAYSNSGDLVLDPFAGTGTTLLAAKKHNRLYVGIEAEEKWYKIATTRLMELDDSTVDGIPCHERKIQGLFS